MTLAWGKKVTGDFAHRTIEIAVELGIEPSWLMACMAFESGRTFSPSVTNGAGSGAVGLIQFMPSTALHLGTSTDELKRMTAVQQLEYVLKYFRPGKGRLHSLEDVYMTILWPNAVGKPLDYVLFDKEDLGHPKRYIQNAGLDYNKDGRVTKAEAAGHVRKELELGLTEANALADE